MMEDWLGETAIQRNRQGKPIRITDHKGRSVGYEWGSKGEQKGMVYPDGTTIRWQYDELLRPIKWERKAQGKPDIHVVYGYDEAGRLTRKKSSGGYLTRWTYDGFGQLEALTHEEGNGILEQYIYGYDELGNKTAVRKERTGLPRESGDYQYSYDGLQRLTGVSKDGQVLRCYTYDAFGNRIRMEDRERGRVSTYHYNAINQLIREEIQPLPEADRIGGISREEKLLLEAEGFFKQYSYDRRGNLIQENGQQNGQEERLLHGYAYDARNRLERAWNETGEEAAYLYNGMGQRVERRSAAWQEEYILDLTKPYHNLLGIQKEEEAENFYWDFTPIAAERKGSSPQYYLGDDLGNPLRVLYSTGKGECYGYDEFGQDLALGERSCCKRGFTIPYTKQGAGQPFGYTGYRYDEISGSYFAQAREYQPGIGRFMAEDVIRGRMEIPKTLNRYGYCDNNPLMFVDNNGKTSVGILDISPLESEGKKDLYDDLSTAVEGYANIGQH